MKAAELATNKVCLNNGVQFILVYIVPNDSLQVLKNFLKCTLVRLLERKHVLGVCLSQQRHIFDLAPTFEIFITSQTLNTVGVLREVTIV